MRSQFDRMNHNFRTRGEDFSLNAQQI